MSRMGDFIAFRAAVETDEPKRAQEAWLHELYEQCKAGGSA